MALSNVHRVKHTRFLRNLPVKGSTTINQGEIVLCQTADGLCKPGAVVTGSVAKGIAVSTVDNSAGADGAKTIDVEQGVFLLANHATNTFTAADIAMGKTAYAEDANTVGDDSTGKSVVGPAVGLGWENLEGVQVRIES